MELAKAITPHKPIVALYVGGSETGSKAGLSHTGALSGPDEIYDALFHQTGIIRARNITELFDYALALGTLPPPRGNRVVIETHSGGPGAVAADACGRLGLKLPALSDETVEKLRQFLPHTASIANPVDLTFMRNQRDYFADIPELLLADERTDMLLMYLLSPAIFLRRFLREQGATETEIDATEKSIMGELTQTLLSLAKQHGKPLVGYTFRSLQEDMVRSLLGAGIPVYPDADRAARSLAALLNYHRARSKFHPR